MLDVFNWNLLENCCLTRGLCAYLTWNLLKLFIVKKIDNERNDITDRSKAIFLLWFSLFINVHVTNFIGGGL